MKASIAGIVGFGLFVLSSCSAPNRRDVAYIHCLQMPVPSWHRASEGLTEPARVSVDSCAYSNGLLRIGFVPADGVLGVVLIDDIEMSVSEGRATARYHSAFLEQPLVIETDRCFINPDDSDGVQRLSFIFDVPQTGEEVYLDNFGSRYLVNVELRQGGKLREIDSLIHDRSSRNRGQ